MKSNIPEDKFKLALATDLIIFMLEVWTKGESEREDTVKVLIDTWSARVDSNANSIRERIAKDIAFTNEDDMITEDVAMIMLDIAGVENKIMKEEFENQIKKAILERIASTP